MNQATKHRLLEAAKTKLSEVRHNIKRKIAVTSELAETIKLKLPKLKPIDQLVQGRILANHEQKAQQLELLYPSPYFIKCELQFDHQSERRIFYFAKFSFADEQIYSWTAPAASIRFLEPGTFSYQNEAGETITGKLESKEQFMISDGKIVFMATENIGQPRELVYQEYFSQRKTTFALPEIVERMEKAQDQVIRASPYGPFLISGPAGSGKTTLALHRVAYLVQSPEAAGAITADSVIVFVQDASSKGYFGSLLPELGVKDVIITTFAEWAIGILNLWEYKYVYRYGNNEAERSLLEYEKYRALRENPTRKHLPNPYRGLEHTYLGSLSQASAKLFFDQQKNKILDRFDLTILLQAYVKENGKLTKRETLYESGKNGVAKKKHVMTALQYSLMIADEVQNYLPEQVQIMKTCLSQKTNALVYVGDLAQQTQLCTMRDWNQVGEKFEKGRVVQLDKNYRSTKQIAEFIKSIGYPIEVPQSLREGSDVTEKQILTSSESVEYIHDVIKNNPEVEIGIIAKSFEQLNDIREAIGEHSHVRVLTITEAQGVEFDIACIIGIDDSWLITETNTSLASELKRVHKDLLYVALTRAMNELHIIGEKNIRDILKILQ